VPLQAAVAAGILALGTTMAARSNSAQGLLQESIKADVSARQIVDDFRSRRSAYLVWTPLHDRDPRTIALVAKAKEWSLADVTSNLFDPWQPNFGCQPISTGLISGIISDMKSPGIWTGLFHYSSGGWTGAHAWKKRRASGRSAQST